MVTGMRQVQVQVLVRSRRVKPGIVMILFFSASLVLAGGMGFLSAAPVSVAYGPAMVLVDDTGTDVGALISLGVRSGLGEYADIGVETLIEITPDPLSTWYLGAEVGCSFLAPARFIDPKRTPSFINSRVALGLWMRYVPDERLGGMVAWYDEIAPCLSLTITPLVMGNSFYGSEEHVLESTFFYDIKAGTWSFVNRLILYLHYIT